MISSALEPGLYRLGNVPVTVGMASVRVGAVEIPIVRRAGRRYLRCPCCTRLDGRLRLTPEGWLCRWCCAILAGL